MGPFLCFFNFGTRLQLLRSQFSDINMADEREKTDVENTTADLQKRIADAFDIFDHESNKTVDVRYAIKVFCPSLLTFFLHFQAEDNK